MAQKWEYYVSPVYKDTENDELTGTFDEEGAAGWEMVGFVERFGVFLAIYKKPVDDDDDE